MKFKYLATFTAASIITLGLTGIPSTFNNVNAYPCASPCAGIKNPCAGAGKNPCAGVNPCAAGAADPCAGVINPCAGANPCAGSNPCAGAGKNPCAGVNPCAAGAADPCAAATESAPMVYTESSSGLAIRGTDPVAYFTEGEAVEGDEEYELEWNDAIWRFSSEENLELFEEDPEAYAPQYGGYCAKALSEGNVVSTDPEAWKIVDDKLYLNYSAGVQQQWVQDIEGNIALADDMWPDVLVGAKVFE